MNEMHEELVTLAFEAGYFTGNGEHWNRERFFRAISAFMTRWDPVAGTRVDYVFKNKDTFIGEDARLAVRELFKGVLK